MDVDVFQSFRHVGSQPLHVPVAEWSVCQLREVVVLHAFHDSLHHGGLTGLHAVEADADAEVDGTDKGCLLFLGHPLAGFFLLAHSCQVLCVCKVNN